MSTHSDDPRPAFWRTHALALTGGALALGVAAALVLPGGGDESRSDLGVVGAPRDAGSVGRTEGSIGQDYTAQPQDGTAVGGTSSGTSKAPGSAATDTLETRVVRTGVISLIVDEGKVSATVIRVEAIAAAVQGFVASSRSDEQGETPSATITVRVPVKEFDKVLGQVRATGAKVVNASTSGRDVTATYADTKAQIDTLKAARSRYLSILAGAKTIAETLTVQQRIDDVQGQIDRLEGQRRVLADQSDLATLTVSIAEEGDEPLLTKPASGWSKAWDDAVDGFTGGLQSMLAASGRVLLLLLVAAALYPAFVFGLRWARRRYVNTAS